MTEAVKLAEYTLEDFIKQIVKTNAVDSSVVINNLMLRYIMINNWIKYISIYQNLTISIIEYDLKQEKYNISNCDSKSRIIRTTVSPKTSIYLLRKNYYKLDGLFTIISRSFNDDIKKEIDRETLVPFELYHIKEEAILLSKIVAFLKCCITKSDSIEIVIGINPFDNVLLNNVYFCVLVA